jgi:hypothetical protein
MKKSNRSVRASGARREGFPVQGEERGCSTSDVRISFSMVPDSCTIAVRNLPDIYQ